MITFTTTATIRPELIDATYASFAANLTGVNLKRCELIINVDPMPADQSFNRMAVVEVAQKYFGKVTHNFPQTPNFPNALKWVWSNTTTEYVFNLEDDWKLLRQVDLTYLIGMLNQNPHAMGVSLNAYLFGVNSFRIRLSPGLFRGDWVRESAICLQSNSCPERQLRSRIPNHLIRPMLNFPEYKNPKLGKIIVSDTGRSWREKRGLIKNNQKSDVGFTTWKKR